MKKKECEKPKKIVFEKLTVKETEKVKGGDGVNGYKPRTPCFIYVKYERIVFRTQVEGEL